MAGNISLNGVQLSSDGTNFSVNSNFKINATPSANNDAATKLYVDTLTNAALPKINIYMVDNATATAIAAANTPVKAAGTTLVNNSPLSVNAVDFDMPANNRVRYIGTSTIAVGVNYAISATSATANQTFGFYLYKNGVNIGLGFKQESTMSTATTSRTGATAYGFVEMATNDYLEVFVENQTAANAITVRQLQITVGGL